MKTPTLEEVKEHFKNAKEVRCLIDKDVYMLNLNNDFDIYNDDIFLEDLKCNNVSFVSSCCIWNKHKGYAEIVSYKHPNDKHVQSVINKFAHRSEVGFAKYGTNLERKDLNLTEWLNHLQEELMDATLYIEKLKEEFNQLN